MDQEFWQVLRNRRSVRRFQPRPVPEETTRRLLEAATWAPSAHNRQPWRFAILTSSEARSRLAKALGEAFRLDLQADGLPSEEVEAQVTRSRQRIQEAPLAVLLCLDLSVGDIYTDTRRQVSEHLMGVQSVALAGGHLLLAAWAEGLSGVWMCAPLFAPEAASQALNLPPGWQPQALILLGYPAKLPTPRPRRPLEEVTLFFKE